MASITRFRIEAIGDDKDELGERMSEAVAEIAKVLRKNGDRGHWECTDEVISQEKRYDAIDGPAPTGRYKGRMVMKFVEYDSDRNELRESEA